MKYAGDDKRTTGPAFTLVELLVVMGIIGLLAGLLLPAVNQAIISVRAAATRQTIQQLSAGIEAFRNDWKVYPPSNGTHEKLSGLSTATGWTGSNYLAYALMGPRSRGWGRAETLGKYLPFGGSSTVTFGPYFTSDVATGDTPVPVQDAFRPAKSIAYFRYESNEAVQYNVLDNGKLHDKCLDSFASQDQLEYYAKPKDATSATPRWVRKDYLLISLGADRYWGPIKETVQTDGNVKVEPATAADIGSAAASVTCDDITNWQ